MTALQQILVQLSLSALTTAAIAQPTQAPPSVPGVPSALEPVSVFAGPPGGVGAIEVYDATTGGILSAPRSLASMRLLPLDHCGRTQLEELFPERPRRFTDLPGTAARLALPFGAGSLYRFERGLSGGGARFGFLLVPDGAFPRVLFELPGHGPLAEDPFVATIAVAPDGHALLVATTLAAGGDLFEVPLKRGLPQLRTANVPPQAFSADGLWLARDFGFGVSPAGIWRFSRTPGAVATSVVAAGAPTWTGQAVMNRSRRHALVTSGTDPLQRDAWVFGATGPAVRASRAPAAISDAGVGAMAESGPWMALSDDGTVAAWSEVTFTTNPVGSFRDIRMQRVQLTAPGPVVTGDSILLDTLDEIARMMFFRPDTLMFAAGEANLPQEGGVATADFFSAELAANGALTVVNLTLTSGDPTVPFTAGRPTLTPALARVLPGSRVVMHDDADEALMVLDLTTGSFQTVESDVRDLYWIERVEPWVCAAVRRRNGQRPIEVLRFRADFAGASVTLDPGSQNHEFSSPVVSGGTLAWIEAVAGVQHIERADPANLTVTTWAQGAGTFAPPLVLRADGAVRFARAAAGGGIESRTWHIAGPDTTLMHPLRPGHWLP